MKKINTKEIKLLVKEIAKVFLLNNPPTWTEENKLEWLFNRLQEVLMDYQQEKEYMKSIDIIEKARSYYLLSNDHMSKPVHIGSRIKLEFALEGVP